MTEFDPVAYKADQQRNWNQLSVGWDAWFAMFERGADPVTRWLVNAANLGPGTCVLDVGTGTGQPALTVAPMVAPGRVVGVDQAGDMLAVARRRAAGLTNVEFVEADAESLDLPGESFDAVLSRWGLMFLPNREAALRTLYGLLRPGGRLAASVWSAPPTVPLVALAFGVIAQRLQLPPPPPGTPGPFSMADSAQTAAELKAAGFTDVAHERVTVTFELDTVDDLVAFSRDVLPAPLRAMIASRYGSEDDPGTWGAVAEAAQLYVATDGTVHLPCQAVCLSATKPLNDDRS